MGTIRTLTEKTIHTMQEDGFGKVWQKAGLYIKNQERRRKSADQLTSVFRDILFVNGCDEHLPHPGRYRVTHQREQLESLGFHTSEVYYQDLQPEMLRHFRTIVFFRCPYTETIGAFAEKARQWNKTLLYDVDDLVIDTVYTDQIPWLSTLSGEERDAYDENVHNMGKLLRLCDGAITTTEGMAQELEKYVPKVLINRNCASQEMVSLSIQAWKEQKKSAAMSEQQGNKSTKNPQSVVKIGYFSGSITHNDDVEMLLPVLEKTLAENPQVQLHLAGELTLPPQLEQYNSQIVVHPFTDWRELPALIASMDINLAPIADTIFNRAKSENKWVEASLVQVPTIASDVGAFHQMIEQEQTGLLCRDAKEWEQALNSLIHNPKKRKMLGRQAYAYCMQNCITSRTGQRLAEWITDLQPENAAFILPAFQVSGGVMVALQHAVMLQKEGRQVMLLSIQDPGKNQGQETEYTFNGHSFPVLNCHSIQFEGNIDTAAATMWSTVDYLYRIGPVKRKIYLVQNYEPDFYADGDPLKMQARKTYGRGNYPDLHYLTISRWCENWLKEDYRQQPFYVPNGLECERFYAKHRDIEQGRKIRILIEGDSGASHKKVDESFRIAKKLDPDKYEIWYMAYHGTPKEWYRVDRFLPEIPYGLVDQIYRQCDILLKSSILESFSYPPLEMMATGGYVVAVQNEGNQEYLKHEENCLIYPAGNIKAAVDAIERIAEDETLREVLYENGQKTAGARDWEMLRERILGAYRQ